MKVTLKLLFIIIIMLVPKESKAQVTTITEFSSSWTSVPMVSENQNGELSVKGDSLTAIKLLWDKCKQLSADSQLRDEVIYNGVIWHNQVSDHFKKGKPYVKYIRYLKMLNYNKSSKP